MDEDGVGLGWDGMGGGWVAGGGWVEDKVYLPSKLKGPHFHVFQCVGNVFFSQYSFQEQGLREIEIFSERPKKTTKEKQF